jgi:hypothetical protein
MQFGVGGILASRVLHTPGALYCGLRASLSRGILPFRFVSTVKSHRRRGLNITTVIDITFVLST